MAGFLPPTADHVIKGLLNFETFSPNAEEKQATALIFSSFFVGFRGQAFIVVAPVEV